MNRVHITKVHIMGVISFLSFLIGMLLLWFVFQFQNYVTLILIAIGLIIPTWSIITAYMTAKGLETDRKHIQLGFSHNVVTKGDETALEFQITNKSFLPTPALLLEFTLNNHYFPTKDVQILDIPSIAPRTTKTITFPIQPIHCGLVEANLLKIRLRDWFGLVTIEAKQDYVMAELLVYPPYVTNSIEIEDSAGGSNEEVESTQEKGYTSSEVLDVRQYIPGDRLQAIHWKLSAKAGELMVKEYENMSADHFQILPDLVVRDAQNMDTLFEVVYGIGMMLLSDRGMGFSIYYWSQAEQKVIGQAVFEESDLLLVFRELFHLNVEQMVNGQILSAFRQFGSGRSGYLLYLSDNNRVAEGELLESYRGRIHIHTILT